MLAYGQAVWYECRRFEVPEVLAASRDRNFKSKAALESMFGQRLCFPKFAEWVAAIAGELRKAGAGVPDAGIKSRAKSPGRWWLKRPDTKESAEQP